MNAQYVAIEGSVVELAEGEAVRDDWCAARMAVGQDMRRRGERRIELSRI